ncbi:MAG: diguanylate cyclase [Planctomycetaceae bacterium]|nr:diguanylate cyclase [Planctomycetaceae bacterium]
MRRFSSSFRIVVGLISLTVSSLLVASLLGLIPNSTDTANEQRRAFCETTAVSFTSVASHMSREDMQIALDSIAHSNADVLSMGVRRSDGELILQIGDHLEGWRSSGESPSVANEFVVAVMAADERWGQLEVRFAPVRGPFGIPLRSDLLLAVFVAISLMFGFYFYLRRVLQHLNPSRVIPPRVREALDALAEGLLVVDNTRRIVLANCAFATHVGRTFESLIGGKVSSLGFVLVETENQTSGKLPWEQTLSDAVSLRGILMKRRVEGTEEFSTFSVSCVPIHDERGRCRGAVISFEDVTELDRKQRELKDALTSLKKSSEEVRQQNKELEWLATRDALTGCINRRSFFRIFEDVWNESRQRGDSVSALMVDIDHFKSINDNHGHAKGDEVLRRVAAVVMKTVSEDDVVCRYGGEEFSVLMPHTSLDDAEMAAERIRLAIMGLDFDGLRVTASLGSSSSLQEAESPQDLLDQADKCLYVAKRNGRNRVIRFDRASEQIAQLAQSIAPGRTEERVARHVAIPFQAVSALLSALAFRDRQTAAHCRRVADLCVAVGEGLLSMRECYTLETAALLHDIGKIGVPDMILHKTTALTDEEFQMMRRHVSMGVHLVKASFGSDELTDIVAHHSVWFNLKNAPDVNGTAVKPRIASRILAIADAYDSMTSENPYRKRRSRNDAFQELRLCSGTQFDPELVERFILRIGEREERRFELSGMSTDFALDIGMQIERLVTALDEQNVGELRELAGRLHTTAREGGIDHMTEVTMELHNALQENADVIEIMNIATQLLDLCRLTQASLIQEQTYSQFAVSGSG